VPSEGNIFDFVGERALDGKVEIEVYNNTGLSLSVKMNDETFSFSPKEKKIISIKSGSVKFRASAPGVLPAIGSENLSKNSRYAWEFYLSSLLR